MSGSGLAAEIYNQAKPYRVGWRHHPNKELQDTALDQLARSGTPDGEGLSLDIRVR